MKWSIFVKKNKTNILLSQILIITIIVISSCITSCAGNLKINAHESAKTMETIILPDPQTDMGIPLMQALKDRKSSRSFSNKKLPLQVLSNLLWAGFGINRPESGKRTAPTAVNWQEIDIYVFFLEGVYIYEAKDHKLIPVIKGNFMIDTGMIINPFVKDAAVNLVYVTDSSRITGLGKLSSKEDLLMFSSAATGAIFQNIYLYCASEGLSTVIRGLVNRKSLRKILNLNDNQKVLLSQSVGYPSGKDDRKFDLAEINNGIYEGKVQIDDFIYRVSVEIRDHKISNIEIISIEDNEYSKKAREIIDTVIKKQSVNVDAISGATKSSRALLMAIENALLESAHK